MFRVQLVNISQIPFDQILSPGIQLLEVIAGIAFFGRLKAQPLYIAANRVDVFLIFFFWIGVIETQIRDATKFLGDSKIKTDRLGVAHVQVAVRLGRKARDDAIVFFAGKIRLDRLGNKMLGCFAHAGRNHRRKNA